MDNNSQKKIILPRSESSFLVNTLAVILFFIVFYGLSCFSYFHTNDKALIPLIALLIMAFFIILYDVIIRKSYSAKGNNEIVFSGTFDLDRILVKLTGLYVTFMVILLLYRFVPYYHESIQAIQFYGYFFKYLQASGPVVFVFSIIYFFWIDRRQKDPYDSYWHVGCLFLGRFKKIKLNLVLEHLRVWFIKAFFSPIMFGFLVQYCYEIKHFQWSSSPRLSIDIYNLLLNFCYLIDICFGVLGYVISLKIFNNHIKSTDSTILGWVVCLACYFPFSQIFGTGVLNYDSGVVWFQWMSSIPLLSYIWGCIIVVLSGIYAFATVAFGYRMSNLTYRGIITSGPYRLTKHPAYLTKVLTWWLITIPFLSMDGFEATFRQAASLSFISLIYYWRAKTEENHLANYPEYIQYAQWVDEYGIFRWFKKKFPSLRFSYEKTLLSKSVPWFKQ